ncbi:MAG: hypothetical protein M1818_002159 [Claussenomyces sp. TS43310]|nr:MAG: hypothetical protein M1818_002159 [Claussenomyces sp. TS43310]
MTRRQELNRQAQRTHRERKELYLKALEVEVLELKQRFSSVQNDKDTLAEENIQLKQLLTQHGIAWVSTGGVETFTQNNPSGPSSNGTTSISVPGSQGLDTFSTSHVTPGIMPRNGGQLQQHAQNMPPLDYDQAGIDFVLTLERPCMDHLQVVLEGSEASGEFEFGHALLASCPPDIYDGTNLQIPPGHGPGNSPSGHKQWDISQGDLANLLDLSKRLNLDGEVTPVMAWGMILDHPRFPELTAPDLEMLTETMRGKTGCYGLVFELRCERLSDVI